MHRLTRRGRAFHGTDMQSMPGKERPKIKTPPCEAVVAMSTSIRLMTTKPPALGG